MSMWEIEGLGEEAVILIDQADLPLAKKRDLILSVYNMISGWDTSFIHFRTRNILVDNQCFFALSIQEHPEYQARKAELDAFVEARGSWLRDPETNASEALYASPGKDTHKRLWFDPGHALWGKAVKAGLLTGLAAEPVNYVTPPELLPQLMHLAHALENKERAAGLLSMFHGFAAYDVGAIDPESDAQKSALALPGLGQLLTMPLDEASTWIRERFDALTQLKYAREDEYISQENLAKLVWWCAPYEG